METDTGKKRWALRLMMVFSIVGLMGADQCCGKTGIVGDEDDRTYSKGPPKTCSVPFCENAHGPITKKNVDISNCCVQVEVKLEQDGEPNQEPPGLRDQCNQQANSNCQALRGPGATGCDNTCTCEYDNPSTTSIGSFDFEEGGDWECKTKCSCCPTADGTPAPTATPPPAGD